MCNPGTPTLQGGTDVDTEARSGVYTPEVVVWVAM